MLIDILKTNNLLKFLNCIIKYLKLMFAGLVLSLSTISCQKDDNNSLEIQEINQQEITTEDQSTVAKKFMGYLDAKSIHIDDATQEDFNNFNIQKGITAKFGWFQTIVCVRNRCWR